MSGSFRERVVAAIGARGWNMREASRQMGVSYDVVRELYRRTGTLKAPNASKISAALGVAIDEGQPVPRPSDGDLVPVYNVQASAGNGALVADTEEVVDRLSFPPGYLRAITKANPRDLAIIGVKGESMSPTLADNDVVMIDTAKRDLSFEGLFVLRDGGASLLVKRIGRASRRGHVLLISDNRAYPPVERAVEDVEVIGKVVWMGVKV